MKRAAPSERCGGHVCVLHQGARVFFLSWSFLEDLAAIISKVLPQKGHHINFWLCFKPICAVSDISVRISCNENAGAHTKRCYSVRITLLFLSDAGFKTLKFSTKQMAPDRVLTESSHTGADLHLG